MSFVVEAGQTVALVGQSGSGKSTVRSHIFFAIHTFQRLIIIFTITVLLSMCQGAWVQGVCVFVFMLCLYN